MSINPDNFSREFVSSSSDTNIEKLQANLGTTMANQEYLRYNSEHKGGRVHKRKRKRNTKKKTMKKRKSHKKKYKKIL